MNREKIQAAVEHVGNIAVLRPVVDVIGPFRLKPERDRFRMLVRSIISQQISVAAARTIRARLEMLVAPEPIAPRNLARLSEAQLRGAGLSVRKASYVRDLAVKVAAEEVRLNRLGRLDDEAVIEELVRIRGIGRWTAQMFLIFALGRLDVFPEDDLGVLSAIRNLYGLAELPDRTTARQLAGPWRPYASVASWYCWRSLDLHKQQKANSTKYPV